MPSIQLKKVPFNHHRSRTSIVTIRATGEYIVGQNIDIDVAEAAVEKGHATWIEAPEEKPATKRGKAAKPGSDAADKGQSAGVDRTDLASDDSANGDAAVADAG
jgi:hypothetical protein